MPKIEPGTRTWNEVGAQANCSPREAKLIYEKAMRKLQVEFARRGLTYDAVAAYVRDARDREAAVARQVRAILLRGHTGE